MASQKRDTNGRIPANGSARSWEVEICLTPSRVVLERARARSPREAVEAALATRRLAPLAVRGVAAYPLRDGKVA
ncbi:MAG: hypothetical protein ABR599_01790 [Gemmatimonadota bacterium]